VTILIAVPFVLLGYLLGAIPMGKIVARLNGVDIQAVGSGNIGATNVLRSVGVVPAIVVALTDPLKGAIASLVPMLLGMDPWIVVFTAFATVLGNNFNVFLGFRGGKGIATSFGVFVVINPTVSLVGLAMALITMAMGRYVSLGSMVGMISAPLFLLTSGSFEVPDLALTTALALLAGYRHRENLFKLAKGTERRLGEKSEPR